MADHESSIKSDEALPSGLSSSETGNKSQASIMSKKNELEMQMIESTERSLRELDEAEEAGDASLELLAKQNLQIDDIQASLNALQGNLKTSDELLQKIASPFAFLHLKTENVEFAKTYGAGPDWSGPGRLKAGTLIPSYKNRYFVLIEYRLLCYGAKKSMYTGELDKPLQELNVKNAKLSGIEKDLQISIKNAGTTWTIRYSDANDYCGWMCMLERNSKGQFRKKTKMKFLKPKEVDELVEEDRPRQISGDSTRDVESKSVDQRLDDNLDLMIDKLDVLDTIAHEQAQAVSIQNEKLQTVAESVEQASSSLDNLSKKHGNLLRE